MVDVKSEWDKELIRLTEALAEEFNLLHPDDIGDSLRYKIQDVLLHMNDLYTGRIIT